MSIQILVGDCIEVMRGLPAGSVQTCVTSPPYFALRSYLPGDDPAKAKEIGLEPDPDAFVQKMVEVFREVRRVLRDDGTLWVNIGDSRASSGGLGFGGNHQRVGRANQQRNVRSQTYGLKRKDLIGIPWMLAFALRADGWYLREEIIWSKPNCMPESVTDRPTRQHEQIFLLSKSPDYYYDAEAIEEPASPNTHARVSQKVAEQVGSSRANGGLRPERPMKAVIKSPKTVAATARVKNNESFNNAISGEVRLTRNKRTVWTVPTVGFSDSHFATFPPDLVEPCILAGAPRGGIVLDPFAGSGTVGQVADRHGRGAILIDLDERNVRMMEARLNGNQRSLLTSVPA